MVLSIVLAYLASLLPLNEKPSASYSIEFEKIDNRAEVYLGDSLIYNSGIVRQNPDMLIRINIESNLIKKGNKNLTVKLINGLDGAKQGDDIHWEIKYFLLKGDEVVDFIWFDGDDGQVGVVFEETYNLDTW